MNFDDLVHRFDSGEVTEEVIDELLLILHPDDAAARQERKERVIVNGEMVKFQVVGLNKQAEQAYQQRLNQPEPKPEAIDVPEQFQDDIPDEVYDHPDYVTEIKQRVGIVQAVRTWGKPQHRIKDNRVEGVKVRCPFSHHVDNDPSAWVNTSKQTWYCGKCTIGGDVIDFYAAAKHDLEPNQYHRTPEFARIVQEMADELGIVIVSTSDGGQYVEARTEDWASNLLDKDERAQPEPVEIIEQTGEGPITYEIIPSVPASHEATEPVTISDDELLRGLQWQDEWDDEEQEELFNSDKIPSFEWRDLGIPENTFLHAWMVQAEKELNWIPYEYFLAMGFQAVGICCGHGVTGMTFESLTGSTVVIMVGESGIGKSLAVSRLAQLIETTPGSRWKKDIQQGVKKIDGGIGSAESLLKSVRSEVEDPVDPTKTLEVPSNVWLVEDELSAFISKASRPGGNHIKQRLMKLHDFVKRQDLDQPEQVIEDSSLTHGERNVHDAYFNAVFLTQNESLPFLADKHDLVSGFFNRTMFFMGEARNRRFLGKMEPFDPDPPYKSMFQRMWNTCQPGVAQRQRRVIPFDDGVLDWIDNHPRHDAMTGLASGSSMYSRWQHQILRFSFLLAVNENSPTIELRHANAAYHLVTDYVMPCTSLMVKLVKTADPSEKTILSDKFEKWVQTRFDKTGLWPELRQLQTTQAWREADVEDRNRALKLMGDEGRMIKVVLLNAPGGRAKTPVLVTPTGDFLAIRDKHEMNMTYDDFYAGKSKR